MASPTARDLGRAAAQNLLRTDPLSEASINLIADTVMNAFAPGHRAEVLNEAADRAEDTATHLRRNYATEQSNGAMNAAADIRALTTPAAAPSDPGRGE